MLMIPDADPKYSSEKRPHGREAPRNDPGVEFDDMPDRDIARIPQPATIVPEVVQIERLDNRGGAREEFLDHARR